MLLKNVILLQKIESFKYLLFIFQVELNVSGAHADLGGKIPLVLGTVPLASSQLPNTAPYTDVPQQVPPTIQDPSQAPTQPVSPASPPGDSNAVGWNLYPSIRE